MSLERFKERSLSSVNKTGPSRLFWRLTKLAKTFILKKYRCLSEVTCQFLDLWKIPSFPPSAGWCCTACWKAWLISLRFARFYNLRKAFKDAWISIERATNYGRIIYAETWLETFTSLRRFRAMATYTQEDGDRTKAAEAFISLLSACKGVFGSDHSFTLKVANQSSSLHRRIARDG